MRMILLLLSFLLLGAECHNTDNGFKPPHIIFIFADDLWNLGYFKKEYTPTYRGFDTFLGYMNPFIGYYDHTHVDSTGLPRQSKFEGIDFYNGTSILKDRQGEYATYLFTETAENIIKNHNASKPLFLYLAHLAVHTGNFYKPLEAPAEVISKFKHIEDINRRIQAAITSIMDDSIGVVFRVLHAKNMLDNSIILFVSDNGGEVNPALGGYGSNYPLRGKKQTFWEGGIHLPALIWSPLLNLGKPRISQQLMHVTDWLPTLYKAAGNRGQQHLHSSMHWRLCDKLVQRKDIKNAGHFLAISKRVGYIQNLPDDFM
ncbi:unnamed protein product [Larinioides sclopetarius]|uniref:Sulfatase N-terminal domain-containing protein n=1 Tax=Larinioides sclopetarius TaxID=280406 RepID=A0AAV2A5F6_9ARAC